MQEIFKKIYEENVWKHGSGEGSTVENTTTYRMFLEDFICKHNIKRVVDLGCGDWRFSKMIDWSGHWVRLRWRYGCD